MGSESPEPTVYLSCSPASEVDGEGAERVLALLSSVLDLVSIATAAGDFGADFGLLEKSERMMPPMMKTWRMSMAMNTRAKPVFGS